MVLILLIMRQKACINCFFHYDTIKNARNRCRLRANNPDMRGCKKTPHPQISGLFDQRDFGNPVGLLYCYYYYCPITN
jgi:hypothetical protein